MRLNLGDILSGLQGGNNNNRQTPSNGNKSNGNPLGGLLGAFGQALNNAGVQVQIHRPGQNQPNNNNNGFNTNRPFNNNNGFNNNRPFNNNNNLGNPTVEVEPNNNNGNIILPKVLIGVKQLLCLTLSC